MSEPTTQPTALAALEPTAVVEAPAEVGEETTPDARQETLLNRLLYRGVLPRYAFPTDVATFYVFDPSRSEYNRPAFQFSPSQGLSIALSQYAPGKEVWIANKRFTSGAIYSPVSTERYAAWQAKRLYYECKRCRFALTKPISEGQKGETVDCPACAGERTFGPARYWFRPPGFAHPVSRLEDVTPDDQPAQSYATRAKLQAPSPAANETTWQTVAPRVRVHYLRAKLLVTNTGPRQEGYTYCTRCGLIEPSYLATSTLSRPHAKPFPDRQPTCDPGGASGSVCLGTDFYSDILLVAFRVDDPVRLTPGLLATDIALRTVSEALATAACRVLQLEPGEIQADFRAALTDGFAGLEAEVFLYDTLPGGAGFAPQAGERAPEVLAVALHLLADCTCGSSCYLCLRSFKNKFEHDRLDRHVGRDLLAYLCGGPLPALDTERCARAAALLAEDVRRQAGDAVDVLTDVEAIVPGIGPVLAPVLLRGHDGHEAIVAITHPLSGQHIPNAALREVAEYSTTPVLPIEDLVIRRNLPGATRDVLHVFGLAQ